MNNFVILLLSFLFITTSAIAYINSPQVSVNSGVQYVNFIPYANEYCNSSVYGIAYSFIANTCLQDLVGFGTETESNVFYFNVNSTNQVTIQQSPPSPTCEESDDPILTSLENGTCIELPKFTTFDGTYPGLINNIQYAQVIISDDEPIYPTNQVIFKVFRESFCNKEPTYIVTITNNLIVTYATRSTFYDCLEGNVFANNCTNPDNPNFHCEKEPLTETCFPFKKGFEQIYCPPTTIY